MSFKKKCYICGAPRVQQHHIIPRAKGGTDDPKNLVPLCKEHHDILEGYSWPDINTYRSNWRLEHRPQKPLERYHTLDGRIVERDPKTHEWRIWTFIKGGLRSDPYEAPRASNRSVQW